MLSEPHVQCMGTVLCFDIESLYTAGLDRKSPSDTRKLLHPERGIVSKQHDDRGRDKIERKRGHVDKEMESGITVLKFSNRFVKAEVGKQVFHINKSTKACSSCK